MRHGSCSASSIKRSCGSAPTPAISSRRATTSRPPEGVKATFEELHSSGLEDRLLLVHGNDSEFPRGEHRDRHTNIGEGHIGVEGFRAILAEKAVQEGGRGHRGNAGRRGGAPRRHRDAQAPPVRL
jgi:hypothetical protein